MADKVTLKDATTGNIIYPQTLIEQVQNSSGTALNNLVLLRDNTSTFTPSGNYNPATKKYVDDKTNGLVGTTTNSVIYIGTTAPATGTTPLLWIDTSTEGYLKYRTSPNGTWMPVQVAYT